jgi:hypothetical protein
MIQVKIKSIWQGTIGVNEKYIVEAKSKFEDLYFWKGDDGMIVEWETIDNLICGRTERPFIDRFGGEPYHLVYFQWKPSTKQKTLF